MYYVDVRHDGLKKFRRIQGADQYVVEQRAQAQREAWDELWRRKCETEQKRNQQQIYLTSLESKKRQAAGQTEAAQEQIAQLGTILSSGLKIETWFDWETLYNRKPFPEPHPTEPTPQQIPPEPLQSDPLFAAERTLLSWIFTAIRRQREETAQTKFNQAYDEWQAAVREATKRQKAARSQYQKLVTEWERQKAAFEQYKMNANAKIDEERKRYSEKDHDAVVEFVDMVLSHSEYPDFFPKQWLMDLSSETGVLILDYELPALDAFPTLKAVRYVQSRDAVEKSFLKENEVAQIYDTAMYQICLRTLHELFESDAADAIKSVTFNGWVNFIDKSNGKPARSCIMSLQATKSGFQQINLSAVDPKTCFRALKGVGSAKLAGMAPVVPILKLNKSDPRFIPAHDAIDTIVETTNIAAISWEEFEFLVRDIFEKEFSANGGEVKITRASRDHGVDAVAFDPDPIRGGKIVIQAKRYTNVVGVSAVRDLYGTLINEGANRGILVTTSQYGPDSYEFAKDKPITLLDGGNLLNLLDRHGHKARIDLAEAKKLGALRDER